MAAMTSDSFAYKDFKGQIRKIFYCDVHYINNINMNPAELNSAKRVHNLP